MKTNKKENIKKINKVKKPETENPNENNNNNNNSNTISMEKLEELKNELFQDIKKINNFNLIIKNFLQIQTSTNNANTNKEKDIIFNIIIDIFNFFIGKIENLSLDLLKFLKEKLNLIENLLIDLLDPEDPKKILSKNVLKIFAIFEIKNFLLKKKSTETSNNNNNNNTLKSQIDPNVYSAFIQKFFLTKNLIEAENLKTIADLFSNKLDLTHLFFILKLLSQKFEDFNDNELNTEESSENSEDFSDKKLTFLFFNLFNFIISLPKFVELKKTKKNLENFYLLKNSEIFDLENEINVNNYEYNTESNPDFTKEDILFFYFEKNLQIFYQRIITKLINSENAPEEIIENLLKNLNKIVLENLENPLIFSDFLINIYEKSKEKDFSMKVLSLSGLFVLITKYKLDYQNYYNMLYKSLCESYYDGNKLNFIFDSKYRNRIFKIFEISLKPASVPILIILSFIKVNLFINLIFLF